MGTDAPIETAWIETFSGLKFHLLDPQPEEISIVDIAHSLSQQCRFTGHTHKFYSVSEHSVFVSRLCNREDALWGLLHDAPETYISDLSRPLKHGTPLGEIYRKIETKIMLAICHKFGLPIETPSSVHRADVSMRFAEEEQLLYEDRGKNPSYGVVILGLSPTEAERLFLERFAELTHCSEPSSALSKASE